MVAIIDNTLGAVFIGFAIACTVFGMLISQAISYFRNYPGDKSIFKILVVVILILETVDQCFIGHLVYFYGISNYLNPIVFEQAKTTWSLILQLTVGAVVGAIVKVYFGFRVWRFSDRNIWVTGLIMILALGQLGLAFAFTVEAFRLPSIFAVHQIQALGTVSLGVGVITDIITAGALCFFLNRLRTGLQSSDNLVNALCNYAINTGVLTSTVSVAVLVLYNAGPANNLYFIATYFTLSKLYAISFMATLNSRRNISGRGTDRQGNTTNHTNLFHLGTRMPSMGPSDLERWDKVDPPMFPSVQPPSAFHGYSYEDK
ncbi:hypothetical protein HYPSUDRAFT_46878 [Hypholoma sublateritium FD-334 SS-4]|uniref:DUF6534 domain-containing protein n=1 Tax=Hypholoma sublateritium (strain FD-334 SS-4) TaxID=945553 RepID=A0A0D2KQQ5_HYPSF|nr:hypothetical protein HYPSUDRAFT_46878 [Hypholoma sublateritium FD-334 SS-4]